MDTKKDDLDKGLSGLIHDWLFSDNGESKIKNIVEFICKNYNEKNDNVLRKRISGCPELSRKLFEKDKDGSFKCSSGIKVEKDNKTLGEKEINDILDKIENKVDFGYEFLLNKDEKHKKLLAELNKMIRKWEKLDDKINTGKWLMSGYKENNTDKEEALEKQKQIKDIAKFISNHYRTFVARLQQGVKQDLLQELFARNKETGSFKYKKAHKFLKEAADRGLIFAVAGLSKFDDDNAFLVDPNDKEKKTLKIIAEKFGDGWVEKINVYAHAWGLLDETFHDTINNDMDFNTLALIPINDRFLSFISSRQTEGVENTCKIINYFTEKYLEENKKQMDVTLEGGSQGVDFITKMVCSTHGKKNRIKNAEITLNINKPHLFQDEYKIFQRLLNTDNSNNIAKINFGETTHDCLHPKCKTDNLSKWLEYYQRHSNNNVEIKDLRKTRSNQQNAFY